MVRAVRESTKATVAPKEVAPKPIKPIKEKKVTVAKVPKVKSDVVKKVPTPKAHPPYQTMIEVSNHHLYKRLERLGENW